MTKASHPEDLSRQIDDLCHRFEDAWDAGQKPRIEDFISQWPESTTTRVIRELLVLEWDLRRSNGESFDQRDYCERFPGHSRFVEAALGSESCDSNSPRPAGLASDTASDGGNSAGELTVSGRLQLVRLHAVGGLGEVHVAADPNLNRMVAVKRIKQNQLNNPESTRRFQLEAEITGRLEHPGIVPVHAVGRDENGSPFYSMKLIRGATLQERVERHFDRESQRSRMENTLEFRKLLNHFLTACHAIDYAHSRGVIHRDIKPSNIMIGKYGETQILDWGLARVSEESGNLSESAHGAVVAASPLADDSAETQAGQMLGTPAFMSPEQASGRVDEIDLRSDVYGLGATLYVIITGRKPFSGDVESVLTQVREGRFPQPRRIRRATDAALEAVCLKAMRRSPAKRYETVDGLAGDIDAYLGDQPVSAWREPWRLRLQRFLRQRQSLLLAAMLLLTVTATFLIANAYRRERVAHALATQKADSASRVSEIVDGLFGGVLLDDKPTFLLGVDYEDGDLDTAAERIRTDLRDEPQIQARLMDTIGEHFALKGELRKGEKFLIPALRIREDVQPQNVRDLASSLHHVGFLRWEQGRIVEARELVARAISLREKAHGGSHRLTVASKTLYIALMSEIVESQDRRVCDALAKRHIRAWQEILKIKQQESPTDPDIGTIHVLIALNQYYLGGRKGGLGKFAEAATSFLAAQIAFEQSNAKGDPGKALMKLMLNGDPEQVMNEAIELSKVTFQANETHPGTLSVQLELAGQMKHSQRAETELRRLLAQARPVFDREPRVAVFLMQLAETLFHRGRQSQDLIMLSNSEELFEEAIEVLSRTLGPEHWQTAEAYKKLGRIERERQNGKVKEKRDWRQAEAHFRKSLIIFDAVSVGGYEYLDHQARTELANVLAMQGRTEDAAQVLAKRDKLRKEHLARIPEIVESIYSAIPDLGVE